MKKIIAIFAICTAFLATEVKAQATIQWPAGPATVSSATATTLVPAYAITVINRLQYLNLTVDTGLVLTITASTGIKKGSLLYVNVTNNTDAAVHAVTGSTGCTMASYTLTSAKTHLFSFVYDGTNFLNSGVIKVN